MPKGGDAGEFNYKESKKRSTKRGESHESSISMSARDNQLVRASICLAARSKT